MIKKASTKRNESQSFGYKARPVSENVHEKKLPHGNGQKCYYQTEQRRFTNRADHSTNQTVNFVFEFRSFQNDELK